MRKLIRAGEMYVWSEIVQKWIAIGVILLIAAALWKVVLFAGYTFLFW